MHQKGISKELAKKLAVYDVANETNIRYLNDSLCVRGLIKKEEVYYIYAQKSTISDDEERLHQKITLNELLTVLLNDEKEGVKAFNRIVQCQYLISINEDKAQDLLNNTQISLKQLEEIAQIIFEVGEN